jgi:hypothetical protein
MERRFPRALARLSTVALLALVVLAPALDARAAASARVANLRAGDMVRGTRLYSDRLLSGRQVAMNGGSHVFRLTLRGLREASLEVLMPPASTPIIALESDVLLYVSSAAAHADYNLAESAPVGQRSEILRISPLGTAYFARSPQPAAGKVVFDVVFLRGRALCLLRATTLRGKVPVARVAAMGRIVDQRLRLTGLSN